jgi:hypothetical protein
MVTEQFDKLNTDSVELHYNKKRCTKNHRVLQKKDIVKTLRENKRIYKMIYFFLIISLFLSRYRGFEVPFGS